METDSLPTLYTVSQANPTLSTWLDRGPYVLHPPYREIVGVGGLRPGKYR